MASATGVLVRMRTFDLIVIRPMCALFIRVFYVCAQLALFFGRDGTHPLVMYVGAVLFGLADSLFNTQVREMCM
jgi:hypothetical protein